MGENQWTLFCIYEINVGEVKTKNSNVRGYASVVSGYVLGVNPFNQPGVESYKKNMFALLGKPGYEEQRKELLARMNKQ